MYMEAVKNGAKNPGWKFARKTRFCTVWPNLRVGLAMERIPFHISGVKNFYVALIFLEILCFLRLRYTVEVRNIHKDSKMFRLLA